MRKNLLRKMIVIFSVMPLLFVACSASPSSNWDIVREGRIMHIASMVGFLNESYGITVGARGSIYFTNSGGEAWAPAENKSLCLFGIEIIDESTAIYCGNGGYVGVTNNSGKTWTDVTNYGLPERKHCRYLSFISKESGWIAAPQQLAATFDGGETWNEITLPEGIAKIKAIDIWSENQGCVLDNEYTLFFTNDGGSTWHRQNIDLDIQGISKKITMAPDTALRFTDRNNGSVIFQALVEDGVVLYTIITEDGGETWLQEEVPFRLVDISNIYLTKDAKTLTLFNMGDGLIVMNRKTEIK